MKICSRDADVFLLQNSCIFHSDAVKFKYNHKTEVNRMELQLKDIELAAERLKPILHHTELDMSSTFPL